MLAGCAACSGQAAASGTELRQRALQKRIDQLAASLNSAQSQVDSLRGELDALRLSLSDVDAAKGREGSLARESPAAPNEDELGRLREDAAVLAAEVKQHEQTKVESESKFPVRVTGLVLFNTFVNQGVVDEIDLPTSALRRSPGESHGSVGGSMRQTWLGLEGRGPVLGAVHTSARVGLDFFGGVTGGLASGPAGIVRLRTAAIRAETERDLFEARFDEPLISPLSPTSLANVAQPALSWSGNLWRWAPELRWQHSIPLGQGRTLETAVGLRDSYAADTVVDQVAGAAGPGELNRRPGLEARVSYGSAALSRESLDSYSGSPGMSWRVGGGGYYAKQNYGNGILINTWALTADWQLPLQRWMRLSGEAYRGTGLGGLGGGAYRDVVQGIDRLTGAKRTIGLDAAGGWVQLQADPTSRLQLNAAFGQDAGSGSELRLLTLPLPPNPLGFYARNRAITGNLIFRPWSSVILSPEYRRIVSWPISGSPNVANVYTLSAGYQF